MALCCGQSDVSTYHGVWNEFWETATIHGYPFISSAKGVFKKVMWVLLSLLCSGVLILNIYSLTKLYLEYPVKVKKEWIHAPEIDFPAVTVCNSNPIKQSLISLSPRINALINRWSNNEQGTRRRRREVRTSVDDDQPSFIHDRKKRDADPDCTTAVNSLTDTCYWVELGSYRQAEGASACNAKGGYLAHVKSQDTWNFIYSQNILSVSLDYWISLNDLGSSGTYVWGDGTPMTWSYWTSGEPSGGSSHCVRLVGGNYWADRYCDSYFSRYNALCEKDSGSSVVTTVAPLETTVEITTAEHTTLPNFITNAYGTWEVVQTTDCIGNDLPESATMTTAEACMQYCRTMSNCVAIVYGYQAWNSGNVCFPKSACDSTQYLSAMTTYRLVITVTTQQMETTSIPTTEGLTTTEAETTKVMTTIPLTTTAYITTEAETTNVMTTIPLTTTAYITTEQHETTNVVTTVEVGTTEGEVLPTSQYPDREPYREDFLQENDFLEALADEDDDIKSQMGYTQAEFILSCSFNGHQCKESDFSTFFNAVHGNCYTFNADWNDNSTSVYTSSKSGEAHGLEIMLNINQEEYLESNSLGAGAVVVVHSAGDMPFPEDEGFLLQPNHITSLQLSRAEVQLENKPYGNCVNNDGSNTQENVFAEQLPVKYSELACEKTCYQRYVIEECGCADPQYPMAGEAFGDFDGIACDLRNVTLADCLYGVELRYTRNELQCSCHDPCRNEYFPRLTSKSKWPSKAEFWSLVNYLEDVHNLNISNPSDFIKKNMIYFRAYFRELNIERSVELPKYTLPKLLASLAGTLGLFLGISIYSMLEFLVLSFDFIVVALVKIRSSFRENTRNSVSSIDSITELTGHSENKHKNTNDNNKKVKNISENNNAVNLRRITGRLRAISTRNSVSSNNDSPKTHTPRAVILRLEDQQINNNNSLQVPTYHSNRRASIYSIEELDNFQNIYNENRLNNFKSSKNLNNDFIQPGDTIDELKMYLGEQRKL